MMRDAIVAVAVLLAGWMAALGCSPQSGAPVPTQVPAAAKAAETSVPAAPTPVVATKSTSGPPKAVDFPAKGRVISLIVPYAAGGTTDIAARVLAPLMEKELGVPVQVVDKPGAGTQTAIAELAMAKPDGYTLSFFTIPSSIMTYIDPDRKASYGRKDLQPVALYDSETMGIAVKADSPYKTLKDLIDAAKASPGQLKIGTAGVMTSTHLVGLALEQASGAKFAYVQFDGGAPAVTALLGGHIDVSTAGAGNLLPHFKSGALRLLAVTDKEQNPLVPGVPTATQQGYNVQMATDYGIIAPAGTPKDVVDVVAGAVQKAVSDQQLVSKLAEVALTVKYMDSSQFAAYWDQQELLLKQLMETAKKQ